MELLRRQCTLYPSFKGIGYHTTISVVAVVGFLDSIVAAKQNAARFRYSISPNRELVALGVSNIVGSFVHGTLPAYGSISRLALTELWINRFVTSHFRTRVNADVGARSQMSSIACSSIVLFATFFLLPYLYFLPKCVLGAMYAIHCSETRI